MKAVAPDEVGKPREGTNPFTGVFVQTTSFIGDVGAENGEGAQAFLVHYPNDNSWLRPHWHRVDQFQVVMGGKCKVGKHPVEPVGIHYADAYTTYGPIVAEGPGFTFFTLRAAHTAKSYYMPDSKELLPQKRGREISAHAPSNLDGLAEQAADETVDTLIERQDDGLEASLISLKPNARAEGPSPADGCGQYYVVVAGSLQRDGRELPERSIVFASPDDDAPELVAGAAGARVLCLQLPRRSTPTNL